MKITYDTEVDAKYISIKNDNISRTEPHNDWLIFDYNESNEIVGIEILNASKNNVCVVTDGSNVDSISILERGEAKDSEKSSSKLIIGSSSVQDLFRDLQIVTNS